METLTPAEALDLAVEMLRAIADGRSYPAKEYLDNLEAIQAARAAMDTTGAGR